MKLKFVAIFAGATLLASTAFAAPFLQASSTENQFATDTKPKVVTMNSTDATSGITNDNGVVTVPEDGTYFLMAAAQVGGKAAGQVRVWMRVNDADVGNSNTIQVLPDPAYTAVLVCQGLATLKKGTKLIWLSTGVDDSLITNTRSTVDMLKKHGFDVAFKETDGAHLRRHVESRQLLQFYDFRLLFGVNLENPVFGGHAAGSGIIIHHPP